MVVTPWAELRSGGCWGVFVLKEVRHGKRYLQTGFKRWYYDAAKFVEWVHEEYIIPAGEILVEKAMDNYYELADALEIMSSKREMKPAKKHGNIPL